MKASVQSLKLLCRESEELIEFGSRVSFFHGRMSSGKSTVVEMVNFCLGGKLVKTPAVSSEVIKVQLSVCFASQTVLFERGISSNSVDVSWQDGEELFLETLPLAAGEQPIIGDEIFNLSDFILTQLGISPIKVRKRKKDENSELHRLSFRDFFKFCYLDQPHLDSSLFRLESPITGEKSKDVMKFVLGFQSDQLLSLQQDLQEKRQLQRSLREAAKQISTFLDKYGFASETQIDQRVQRVNTQADMLEAEREEQEASDTTAFLSDELRARARTLEAQHDEKSKAIVEIQARIDEQTSLRAELIALKMKAARATSASSLLEGAGFAACPSCGTEVGTPTDPHHCALCKSDISGSEPNKIQSAVIEQDLTDRIEDLKLSLRRLDGSLRVQKRALMEIQEMRSAVALQISDARESIESEYLQRARKIESELGKLNERRRFLMKVRAMPAEIEERQSQADRLNADISRIQRLIEKEEEKFERGRENVAALERNFLAILRAIHFPEIAEGDRVQVNTRTWLPYIYAKDRPSDPWTFEDAGSGGKTVLFKICYALAIHKTAAEQGLFLPRWFIVDSTMKNITPDINPDVFKHFYDELYRLLNDELKDWQCIIVDQTFSPFKGFEDGTFARKMVIGDAENPPLIGYYTGH